MTKRTALALLLTLLAAGADHALRAQVPQAVRDRDLRMAELAVEAAQRGPVTPIPLTGQTTRVVGVVYDQYLLGALIARAQIAAGDPAAKPRTDAAAIVAHPLWQSRATVVVAYPIDCEGRPNQPLAIRWTTRSTLPVTPKVIAGPVRGSDAQAILPGVGLSADALVVSLQNAMTVSGAVEIDYEGPVCRGAAKTSSFALQAIPSLALARGVNGIKIPEQLAAVPSPSTVRIQVTLDAAGRARFPEPMQGPTELTTLAIAEITSKTYPPSTINGVPMPMNLVVTLVYTTTGEPGTAAPFATPSSPPGTIATQRVESTMSPGRAQGPPPPVAPAAPGLLDSQLARIAAEIAQKGDPVPAPLDVAGPVVHGVVFDRFLVGAVKARAAFKAGTPIDPATAPPTLVQGDLIAVAFPFTCDGRTIAPRNLAVSIGGGTRPGPLRETGVPLTGTALEERLPGVVLPAGAVGNAFAGGAFSLELEVRVTYADIPCGGADPTLTFPIQWNRGQSVPRVTVARLPAGSALPSPTDVRLRGMVDLEGTYRFPTIADGPAELAASAAVVASQWKFQPYRANGVPVPLSVLATLTFTASGMPEAAPPVSASGTTPPELMTSSTIGGRSTVDFTTPSVADLSAATSKCEIATGAYGLEPGDPIKVGGGPRDGPARERAYLSALRGPAGEGLRVVRLGTTMGADKETILDLYEITYAGLAAPLRLFLDEYHDAPTKAPQGLTCTNRF